MPWVRLDDRFTSHRKVALLSDRAFRLHVSAICWSAENLTDGLIGDKELRVIAHVRGTKAAAKELEDAQLWERVPVGWQIHDYLTYQPSREQVMADRDRNAARQQAFRDRKKDAKDSGPATSTPPNKPMRNAVTPSVTDSVSNSAPYPNPNPVLPTEVPPPPPSGQTSTDVVPAHGGGRGEVQPLIDAMAARGMHISWTFHAAEWIDLRDAIRRVGVPALVDHAARAWTAAKNQPYSARYFLSGWLGLQTTPAFTGPRALASGPSKASNYLADMAAITEELRAAEGGNA